MTGPLIVKLEVVIRAAEYIAKTFFKRHRKVTEAFGELHHLFFAVALHNLHVPLFALLALSEVNGIAKRNGGHLAKVAEHLPMMMAG